jgi:vesicle coat complex subunit
MNNQLRQIRDIQIQADRICSGRASLDQVEEFGKYSRELKQHLSTHIHDEFVQKLITEIPDLESAMNGKDVGSGLLDGVLLLLGTAIPLLSSEARKVDRAKSVIKEIQGKYSSIGLVLQNQSE